MLEARFRELSSRNRANRKPGIARDTSGNVLPMMAVGFVVLAALVGSGVDMSRAYKTQRRLQAACDAGALAGRRAVGTAGFVQSVKDEANSYFHANFDDAQQQSKNTVFTPTSNDNGNTIVGTATTEMSTLIMKIFGFQKFDLSVSCQASMGVGNSDVMFVLDNTGSMAQEPNGTAPESGEDSKLQSLQKSMKKFYDTVASSVAGSNARIRYGFVPYSSAVNVGAVLRATDPSYLADSMTVQSIQYVNWSAVVSTSTGTDTTSPTYGNWSQQTQYNSSSSCNAAKPADTSWADNGSPTSTTSVTVDSTTGQQVTAVGSHQQQRYTDYECQKQGNKWYIYRRTVTRYISSFNYSYKNQIPVTAGASSFASAVLQPRTLDVSAYKMGTSVTLPFNTNNTASQTSNVTSTWAGCIRERQTTPATAFSFVSLATGITPGGATDLDIDTAPGASVSSKWAPLWPEAAYAREDSTSTYHLVIDDEDDNNTDSDTNVYNEVRDHKVSTGCPRGAKLLATMTESEFDAYADTLIATGNTYHDIGVLWGARLSSPTGIWASSNVNAAPANGGTVSRHMVFMTDGELMPSINVNSSYGIERNDKTITGDGNPDTQWDNHRARFLVLCEAVKARGIRLWVIAFGTELTDDLVACATDGLASAFEASNSAELDTHFQEIAKQVGELRIIQ